jgi:hypothetical protein
MLSRFPTLASWAVGVGLALASTTASAAPNPTLLDKKVRIHAGTDFFSFSHFNPDGGGEGINQLGFGIGRSTGLDRGLSFLNAGVVSLGAGAVILQGRAVVGGQIAFTVDGIDVGNDGGTLIVGRFTPYFNWMFGPFGRVRPWIGLRVGLGGSALHDEDAVARTIYPIVGLQGGAHIFLVDAVSLDLGLTFDYAAPHGRFECDCVDNESDYTKLGDWFNLAMPYAGLSAWF